MRRQVFSRLSPFAVVTISVVSFEAIGSEKLAIKIAFFL